MSYHLNAAVGLFDRLRQVVPDELRPLTVPLNHRLGFVPLFFHLYRDVGPAFLEDTLSQWSRSTEIAQLEADFHGGDGDQTASVWRDGQRVWGPSYARKFPTALRHEWPINAALARLGVVLEPDTARPEHHDLFVESGLGAEADYEGWKQHAAEARQHATYDEWHAAREARRQAQREADARRAKHTRLPGVPVPLTGKEIMATLEIPASRQVGIAIRFLQNLQIERGSLSREEAVSALHSWYLQSPEPTNDR